jgi:uncharacterized protein involved in exopolysaccharide biosynthesis
LEKKSSRDVTSKSGIEGRRAEAMESHPVKDEEVSLLALGTTLIRNRWRILRWMVIGAVLAATTILLRPRTYIATASFISQGADQNRSGLANLAGQMGIFLPTGNQSYSPDFYVTLLESPVVLLPVARDTIAVAEMGGKQVPVLDLFGIPAGPTARREEQAVAKLQRMLSVSIAKSTGIIEYSFATQWRSVSLTLVTDLLDAVNHYNEVTRQGQATGERKFIEGRLSLATNELTAAENRLTDFQRNNRNYSGSPDLVTERERLQRDVELRQQVFTTLTQAYEEARIREVRDTPVITVFEPPAAPTAPQRRGLLIGTVLGILLGGLIGVFLSFTIGLVKNRRAGGNTDADEFANAVQEAKGQLLGSVRGLRSRRRS